MKWLFPISGALIIFWEIVSQGGTFPVCSENMIFFPLDKESSNGSCDCLPSYLYFSEVDSCHEPYKQGPCPPENYLVLPPGEILARCEKNPCLEDGLVPFEGSCVRLKEHCGDNENYYLIVKPFDFTISCTVPVFHAIVTAPGKVCPNGSRRNALGICRQKLE